MHRRTRWMVGCFCLLALGVAVPPACGQLRGRHPELLQVTPRVWCATGYALGNVMYVRTDEGVVVIDTTESPVAARDTLLEFRKQCDLPITHVIYTHFHGDHINGARAFDGDKPKIIAQALHFEEIGRYRLLYEYNRRLNAIQFASSLADPEPGIALAIDARRPVLGYLAPTVTFDEELCFETGGIAFELRHAPGETLDQCFVWLPGERVLFPGDLFYASFPMLASPMKPDRPVLHWAQSVEKMAALDAQWMVPSHGDPVAGRDEIRSTLSNYASAIRFVHDETIKRINAGLPLEQIRREVRLPESLSSLPYLAPYYGRVEWGVNGVFRQYTGWYDLVPAHLNPGPRVDRDRAIVEAAGGSASLVARTRQALEEGQAQLALELATIVLRAEPANTEAHHLSADALDNLAAECNNTVMRNVYRVAAQQHRETASRTAGP